MAVRARWWRHGLDPVVVRGSRLDLSRIRWRGAAAVRSGEVEPSGGGSGIMASSATAVASIHGGSSEEVPGSGEEEPSSDGSGGVASVGIRTELPSGGSDDVAAWCGSDGAAAWCYW